MNKKYLGIVEGFFSRPLRRWAFSQRRILMNFIKKHASNLNTYLYCPKDDPYVTKYWYKKYPVKQIRRLRDFIQICKRNDISFFYGLNPDIDEGVDFKNLENSIIKKLNQILNLGCRDICLLFDDIPIAYDVVDSNTKENDIYSDIINLVNRIFKSYEKKIKDFWFCNADYCFRKETDLTNSMRKLNRNIKVIWTGNYIFTKELKMRDIKRVQRILFKDIKLIYWSNYPVNDCEQAKGTFNLGGFYPLKKEVVDKLEGIVVNPMRECYANLPFLLTFSNFLDGTKYERRSTWRYILKDCFKVDSNIIDILNCFSSRDFIDREIDLSIYKVIRLLKNTNLDRSVSKYSKTNYGQLFLKTVNSILYDAKLFKTIMILLEKKELVPRSIFKEFDWFPTKKYIARYFIEILEILQRRLGLYINFVPFKFNWSVNIYKYIGYFKSKYKGKNKLRISREDEINLIKIIETLIEEERDVFLSVINKKDIDKLVKIKLILKRRNINRFTYDR